MLTPMEFSLFEKHDGNIAAENSIKGGVRFIITLYGVK